MRCSAMMKKNNNALHKKHGLCTVDLLLLIVLLSTLFAFYLAGIQWGVIVFVISSAVVFVAVCAIAKTLEFFDTVPRHCESGKCNLFLDCYKVRFSESIPCFLYYYKCQCGKDYFNYDGRFFAKINEDGSLEPYRVKYTTIFGFERWCDDQRMDSEVRH